MFSQHFSERRLNKMNSRVISLYGLPSLFIYKRSNFITNFNNAVFYLTYMKEFSVTLFGVNNFKRRVIAFNYSGIADLTAAFSIKSRSIQN